MQDQVSSLDVYHVLKEFDDLEQPMVNKLWQDGSILCIHIYAKNDRPFLLFDLPGLMYLSEDKPSFNPTKGFGRFLRKRLTNARITKCTQVGFDRVVHLELTRYDDVFNLYVELFGKGNIVVCDSENKILSLLESVAFSDRQLRGGVQYTPPSSQPDIREISFDEFKHLLSSDNLEKDLATKCGLGGTYASLLRSQAGTDEPKKLFEVLQQWLGSSQAQQIDEEIYPFVIDSTKPAHDSFSSLLADKHNLARKQERQEQTYKTKQKSSDKLQKIISAQTKQVVALNKEIELQQRAGELIYEKYQELTKLLEQARKDRKLLGEAEFKKKYESYPYVSKASLTSLEVNID